MACCTPGVEGSVLLEQGETTTLHPFFLQLTWTGFAHQEGFEEGEFWKDEPSEEAPMELGLKDPEEGTLPFSAQSLR